MEKLEKPVIQYNGRNILGNIFKEVTKYFLRRYAIWKLGKWLQEQTAVLAGKRKAL